MDDVIALEFLARFHADREAGEVRPLRDYLALHPGYEAVVAEEYFAAVEGESAEVVDSESTSETAMRYRRRSLLGAGGMGRVYLTHDTELDRDVALKTPREERATFAAHRGLLVEEARTTAELRHPALPPIHDIGLDERGTPFYVMRRLQGDSLAEVLGRDDGESWPLSRLLSVYQQICSAVAFAHSRGVLHLDLKPANIVLDEFGEPIVVDWGLARSGVDQESGPEEAIAGTPGYMPPEQASGQPLSRASDVFALGAVLYEILLRERPFVGTTTAAVLEHTHRGEFRRGASFDALPTELRQVIERALAVDPSQRPASALELQRVIEQHLEGRRDRAAREREATRAVRDARRHLADCARLTQRVVRLRRDLERTRPDPWSKGESKRSLWAREDEAAHFDREVEIARERAVDQLDFATRQVPDHEEARTLLGQLYAARVQEAERSRHELERRYYLDRLGQLELPAYDRFLADEGELRVSLDGAGRSVKIRPVSLSGVVAKPRSSRPVELETPLTLSSGSYLVAVENDAGRFTVPCAVRRGERTDLRVQLPSEVPKGFVWIAPGPATVGGDPHARGPVARRDIELDGFFLARYPVTLREYGEFLASLPPHTAAHRSPKVSRTHHYPFFDADDGFRLRARRGSRRHGRWPVFGVDWNDARAYARWRSRRDGRSYRLPNGDEWEKAARGADGRFFPWGDRFDPSLSKTRRSSADRAQPAVIGEHRHDRSPYGVRDLAGGVSEWCRDWFSRSEGKRLVKGGAWTLDDTDARAASRTGQTPDSYYPFLGFRLSLPHAAR